MTLSELREGLSLSVICGEADGREFSGVYVGDLLSRAMSRVTADDLWITIMQNRNVIAVAELTGCSAVILAEGVILADDAKAAAEENGITVLSSDKTAFDLCRDIARLTP